MTGTTKALAEITATTMTVRTILGNMTIGVSLERDKSGTRPEGGGKNWGEAHSG